MRHVIGLALLVAAVGCDDNGSSSPDLACVNSCIDDTTVKVCSTEFKEGWFAKQCPLGSKCMDGMCGTPAVSAAPCLPGGKVCGDSTTTLTCNPNGFGYLATPCPANTQCVGAGLCFGSCQVGFTACDGAQKNLTTCVDGFNQVTTPCPTGTMCITDQKSPGAPGICVKGDCTPDPQGCNSVCGVMTPSPSPAPNVVSTCTDTHSVLGYRWLATVCATGAICDPLARDCNTRTKQQAACASNCTPGAVRCSTNLAGVQTCGADGNWAATVACTNGQFCSTALNAICADVPCLNGAKGVCVDVSGVSQIRACTNGVIAASPSPCTIGTCIKDPVGGLSSFPFTAGVCVAECQTGDLHCTGGGGVGGELQACGSAGLWAPTATACPANNFCFPLTLPSGRKSAVCGVCQPDGTRCVDSGGNQNVAGPLQETCGSDGQWGMPQTCSLGQCNNGVACHADCVPSSLLCAGYFAPSPEPNLLIPGTSAVITCTANGLWPIPAAQVNSYVNLTIPSPDPCWNGNALPAGVQCCSTNGGSTVASCRKDVFGNSIGCVSCVGSGTNEYGLIDTRCDPGSNGTQICKATNDGWQATTACPGGTTCRGAGPLPQPFGFPTETAPTNSIQPSCHLCPATSLLGGNCTEGTLNQLGTSCAVAGEGAPMSCGNTNDCCSATCYLDNPPFPAFCGG
jgi:hypothetical protein